MQSYFLVESILFCHYFANNMSGIFCNIGFSEFCVGRVSIRCSWRFFNYLPLYESSFWRVNEFRVPSFDTSNLPRCFAAARQFPFPSQAIIATKQSAKARTNISRRMNSAVHPLAVLFFNSPERTSNFPLCFYSRQKNNKKARSIQLQPVARL